MPKGFCLLNHQLTERQIEELKNRYKCEKIIYPSQEFSAKWAQIPPSLVLDLQVIKSIVDWLSSAKENDVFVVQGEYGSTFALVDYALKKNLIPIYSVTKRIAKEEKEGEKITRHYVFEHECFRQYSYFKDLEEK